MLRRYFCADLMTDSYKLSKLDLYYAPAEGPLSTTRAYIETLPLDEDPEVFGLHPNANIAYERKTVGDLSETVIMIQPRIASTGAGRTPDEIAQDLCREIAAKLPPAMDRDAAHETTFTLTELGQPASLGVFLGQEVDRFNALLRVMRATLDQLDRAVQGTVVMSAPLESMAARFLLNKVPA
jgi:dynein heavy chain